MGLRERSGEGRTGEDGTRVCQRGPIEYQWTLDTGSVIAKRRGIRQCRRVEGR